MIGLWLILRLLPDRPVSAYTVKILRYWPGIEATLIFGYSWDETQVTDILLIGSDRVVVLRGDRIDGWEIVWSEYRYPGENFISLWRRTEMRDYCYIT